MEEEKKQRGKSRKKSEVLNSVEELFVRSSQAMTARPVDKDRTKVKTLVW
jgi:hypothetical protein